jgi:hypothetical protein
VTNYGYVVVTINQASRHAEEVNGVHWTATDAEEVATAMTEQTAAVGRQDRHVVCELVEVEQ